MKLWGYEVKIITSNCPKIKYPVRENQYLNDPDIIRIGSSVPIYGNRSFGHLTIGAGLSSKMRDVFEAEKFDLIHIIPDCTYLALDCAPSGQMCSYRYVSHLFR